MISKRSNNDKVFNGMAGQEEVKQLVALSFSQLKFHGAGQLIMLDGKFHGAMQWGIHFLFVLNQ